MNKLTKVVISLTTIFILSGCESFGHYYQAIEGQLSILNKRQPIVEVINDKQTPEAVKEKLNLIQDVRVFAKDVLKLEVGEHYSQYVDLKRPYVVWNVFAAPEFSIKPKTWCFPVAGCVAYKGFFEEQDAKNYSMQLAKEGYDTYVGGIAAYSTLGWFEDPVLNTFFYRSDASLAGLIIHELAHQELYVENDSSFNESFATTVEILGLNQWLTQQSQASDIAKMQQHRARKQQFIELILSHRSKLETIYQLDLPKDQMKLRKQKAKGELLQSYAELKTSWQGYSGYDRWFEGPLNNAQFSTIATYHHWVDSFIAIFHQSKGDWLEFYQRCHEIAQLKPELRDETLEKLSVEGRNYRL